MKKIINDKLYDTEKSSIIFEFRKKLKGKDCWFKEGYSFYYWTDAQIYKTSKGNYFIHFNSCEGYDEIIEPSEINEVKSIIKRLDVDKYIELFGTNEIEEA